MTGLTVETLTVEVGKVLAPLRERLAAGQVEALFRDLGLPAPAIVLAAPQVAAAIGDVAEAAGDLPERIATLVDAITDEDVVAITAAVAAVVPVVRAVVNAVDALRDRVQAAATAAGSARAEVEAFAPELPERLFGYLLATYIDRHRPALGGLLALTGVIDVARTPATGAAPAHVRRSLRLDRVGSLLDDPVQVFEDLYGWGGAAFDWDLLLKRVADWVQRLTRFSFVVPDLAGGADRLRLGFVDITPTEAAIPGVRAAVQVDLTSGVDLTIPLASALDLEVKAEAALEGGAAIELAPPAEVTVIPPSVAANGLVRAGIATSGTGPLTVLGVAAGPRIEADVLRFAVGADLDWDVGLGQADGTFVVEAAIDGGRVVITLGGADGFLSTILPAGGFTVEVDAVIGWSAATGWYFEGGATLDVDIPVDVDLGVIKVPSLHLGLGPRDGGLALETSGAISAQLGPFAMAVERMGAEMRLTFPDDGGNLGVADLAIVFKPPSGIGLSLDAGVVRGGGFLAIDEAKGEYAGVLELALGPVSIKAIGILTTKLPGGQGWALLLLVFAEFNAVQLGFGFTLNGVGGIIGLQHGISTTALQSGLRTGVLDNVLFPANPVANAPTLLQQLRVVFPIVPRALTVGPVLKIGWSTPPLVTISLGIVLQFDDVLGAGDSAPQLSRVVLLGQLKVQIPPVEELGADVPELLKLLVDIVGSYEVREQSLAIDARLRDSHVAGLPLTGSLVVRARFGAEPSFIMAVGGFHPRFTDLPPGLPAQERVGIQLQYGIVTVRIVGYTAITSNSFQIGAEASLVAAGGGFRVEAYLGFDALFLFEPVFHFEIDFRVGAAIKYKSLSLASVKVKGTLSGPGRWRAAGSATISLLFWDVDIDFEAAWGSAPAVALPSRAVGAELRAELAKSTNWTAALPAGGAALVTLRRVESAVPVLAHPLGELTVLQRVVPLGITIDKVGNARPSDGNHFDITEVKVGDNPVQPPQFRDEHFARGEFLDLTEEQKLSTPSFERFPAGVAVSTSDYTAGTSDVVFAPDVETVYLGEPEVHEQFTVPAAVLLIQARFGAASHSQLRRADQLGGDGALVTTLTNVAYAVVGARDLHPVDAGGARQTFTAASQASAAVDAPTMVVDVAELVPR